MLVRTSVLLIPVGEIESGKTTLLEALKSPDHTAIDTPYQPTIAPDIKIWKPGLYPTVFFSETRTEKLGLRPEVRTTDWHV
jgi:hypothetical protein